MLELKLPPPLNSMRKMLELKLSPPLNSVAALTCSATSHSY